MSMTRYILRRFARVVAFVGLAAWAIGTVLVLMGSNAELFQRFGALGVAASVLFFTDRLAKIELGRQKSVEKLLHEYGIELTAIKQGTPPSEIPQDGYAVDFLTEERNFDKLRAQAETFNFFNVVLLTVATLQWGFGDRLVNHLNCGAAQC
ncbi:hypothetical protein [uncultured Tateyamaria sp.]|uniref:hypothetical protein n=1 Tax=uncultured Tateyamaria sp. TaxID=455651 RepID=UPI00260D02C3|nr:hypothetical protein [uncultured Tateyamaria sp.]